MKKDLIMGWVFIALALLMVFCIVVNCVNGSWCNLPICGFAFGMNIVNAVNRFRDYNYRKKYAQSMLAFNATLRSLWPDIDDDKPEDNSIITD